MSLTVYFTIGLSDCLSVLTICLSVLFFCLSVCLKMFLYSDFLVRCLLKTDEALYANPIYLSFLSINLSINQSFNLSICLFSFLPLYKYVFESFYTFDYYIYVTIYMHLYIDLFTNKNAFLSFFSDDLSRNSINISNHLSIFLSTSCI